MSSVPAIFTVVLSHKSDSIVTVDYQTVDGTAKSGTDYDATNGTLTFMPGENIKTITVMTHATLTGSVSEWFDIILSNPTNSTIAISTGKCTITGTNNGGVSDSIYADRFTQIYTKMMNPDSGYFGPKTGTKAKTVPYHMLEDIIVEAPDWGQESVSETASFYSKITAWNGILTGNTDDFKKSWDCIENNFIPSQTNQPWGSYTPNSPAQVVIDAQTLEDTPIAASSTLSAGQDPLYSTLSSTYGTEGLYLMHWLIDVDGIYGFHNGDGSTQCVFINNYQRGPVEDGWATITHPCWEDFNNGGTTASGFLPIYGRALPNYSDSSGSYAKQFDYSVAPDAESRSIIASYLVSKATGDTSLSTYNSKAIKMADYQRYAFYDKYFRPIPGYDGSGCHYLLSWGCGHGGALPSTTGGTAAWGFRIGNSEIHHGYNCVDVAYICSSQSGEGWSPQSTGAGDMYAVSLDRQLEFIRWLQTSDGPIAGGCSSDWAGDYSVPTDGRQNATFYGLYYTYSPSWHNPPSNDWAGYQGWSMERVARLYQMTAGSASSYDTSIATRCKTILDRWVLWIYNNTTVTSTSLTMPSVLTWTSPTAISGQTASAPNAEGTYEYLPTLKWDSTGDYASFWNASTVPNPGLKCTWTNGIDGGMAGATVETIVQLCKGLEASTGGLTGTIPGGSITYQQLLDFSSSVLDCLWNNYQDIKGFYSPQILTDYTKLNDPLFIPTEFGTGHMPDGSVLAHGQTTFLSMRQFYKTSTIWSSLNAYLNGTGPAPTVNYHRFWQNAEIACAHAMMAYYFPDQKIPTVPSNPTNPNGTTLNTLSTSGSRIVDSQTGETVVLKAINWAGAEANNYVPDGLWSISYKDLIDQIASWGFNCIRFPFSGDTFKKTSPTTGAINIWAQGKGTGQYDNIDFTTNQDQNNPIYKDIYGVFDTIISYCATKGIRIVFDHHRRAAGSGGTDGSPTDATYTQSDWEATWTALAQHYTAANGFSNVCGADLYNEPYQLNWSDWVTACNGVISAIQAVNTDWLIIIEGVGTYNGESTWWGGQLQGVADLQPTMTVPNKLVYSPHEYGQSVGSQTWLETSTQSVTNYPNNLPAVWDSFWGYIATQNIAPIWIGEFGGKLGVDGSGSPDSSQTNASYEVEWIQTLVSYIESKGLSFSYWDFGPNSSDTGGLLEDDWITPQTTKLSLIGPLLS